MMNLQPTLENENVKLVPLQETDFERLYDVASDPLIWEQHPNKDRYKREIFQTFFFNHFHRLIVPEENSYMYPAHRRLCH